MGFGSKKPASNNFAPRLGWGVHKVRVTEAEVKLTKKGNGYTLTVSVEDEAGSSAKFVSAGYFQDVLPEQFADFEKASELYYELETREREVFKIEDEMERKQANEVLNAEKSVAFKTPFFGLKRSLEELTQFIGTFSQTAYEAVYAVNADSIKGTLEAYAEILKNAGYAWVFLMSEESANKETGKVSTRLAISQNFQKPTAFRAITVQSVEPVVEENENLEQVTVGYKVTFNTKRKPATIKKNKKNYITLGTEPNDAENSTSDDGFENTAALLDQGYDMQGGDLPF